ncbi:zinc finger protein 410 isoform X1 [Spea bombifrons]|uniref:zinc finger protein 410 isoform X1 n=1 Tax=Spea bombifrons TaxID=233779 RepID=UPI00234A46F8|nr:zinc finger protein 410 isoform X1 [Spea bombifrons]
MGTLTTHWEVTARGQVVSSLDLLDSGAMPMLSDELQSRPELLVEFVQNTSIPLGEELVESECKALSCLSPLPESEAAQCGSLLLDAAVVQELPPKSPGATLLNTLHVDVDHSADPRVGKNSALLSPTDPPTLLQDLPPTDNSSFILLNLARTGLGSPPEQLVFVHDEAEDSGNDFLSSDCTDSSTPWFLRVQELAHDSLIAATRAQLAKSAKTICNGEITLSPSLDVEPRTPLAVSHLPPADRRLRCSFRGCDRSFVWATHLKYHLKTHRNDRSFACPAEGCGKSFYVLQRLKVHMRTHNGERPFLCPQAGCGKQFTTAGNLKNHLRIHTGEKPFVCEAEGCGRSFAEYSSLRKHMVVHSGVKSHPCPACGKTFSQSGSRNAHVRKHHPRSSSDGSVSAALCQDPLQQTHLLSGPTPPRTYEQDVSLLMN